MGWVLLWGFRLVVLAPRAGANVSFGLLGWIGRWGGLDRGLSSANSVRLLSRYSANVASGAGVCGADGLRTLLRVGVFALLMQGGHSCSSCWGECFGRAVVLCRVQGYSFRSGFWARSGAVLWGVKQMPH